MMARPDAPNPAYVGAFRGEPGLERIGVRIGDIDGSPPSAVADALAAFEHRLKTIIATLDVEIGPGARREQETPSTPSSTCALGRMRNGRASIRLRAVTPERRGCGGEPYRHALTACRPSLRYGRAR